MISGHPELIDFFNNLNTPIPISKIYDQTKNNPPLEGCSNSPTNKATLIITSDLRASI
jgi:hypothetical protein